jgi:hypothetical protein
LIDFRVHRSVEIIGDELLIMVSLKVRRGICFEPLSNAVPTMKH